MADNCYDDPVGLSLLCAETNSPCFNDLDSPAKKEATQDSNGEKGLIFGVGGSEPLIDVPCLSEECFGSMVERESQHLPKEDYLRRLRGGDCELSVRREAIDWIWKAHSYCMYEDLTLCLSISYLDRFLSMYEMPEPQNRTWAVQLLAFACLSLAAKMEEINVFLTSELQMGEPEFLFDGETVQRMELLLLNTLNWRMQPYTPCIFVDHFLRKIIGDDEKHPPPNLVSKSIQMILGTMKGIDFLEFRPSEIAAAVAMSVSGDTPPVGEDIFKAIPCFTKVHKGKVMKCVEMIKDFKIGSVTTARNVGNGSSPILPPSPNGVIEAACLSYKSDDRAVGSCPNYSRTTPGNKRRRLDTSIEKKN